MPFPRPPAAPSSWPHLFLPVASLLLFISSSRSHQVRIGQYGASRKGLGITERPDFHLKLSVGSIRWTHHSAFYCQMGMRVCHSPSPQPRAHSLSPASSPTLDSAYPSQGGTSSFWVHPPSGLFSPCTHMMSSYFSVFSLFERKKQNLPHPAYFYFFLLW